MPSFDTFHVIFGLMSSYEQTKLGKDLYETAKEPKKFCSKIFELFTVKC